MKDKGWTYGAEHELGDWDRRKGIPPSFGIDERDVTMVNSNGIAVDPKGKMYPFGGEFNTPPTHSPEGQAEALKIIKAMHPEAVVNYRSNLHIHIHIPGLSEDLEKLKSLGRFNCLWARKVLPLVEPIPEPTEEEYATEEAYQGARRRWRRRRKSHHTVLSPQRVTRQLQAKTVQEFHDFGVPWSKEGKPLPFCQPRCAINVRQLLETDTIEFRHFPGTLDPEELLTCVEWCRDYLQCWKAGKNPRSHFHMHYLYRKFPEFLPYVHWMEVRYRATCHDGHVPKGDIATHISAILEEDMNEYPSLVPR